MASFSQVLILDAILVLLATSTEWNTITTKKSLLPNISTNSFCPVTFSASRIALRGFHFKIFLPFPITFKNIQQFCIIHPASFWKGYSAIIPLMGWWGYAKRKELLQMHSIRLRHATFPCHIARKVLALNLIPTWSSSWPPCFSWKMMSKSISGIQWEPCAQK